MTTSTGFSEDDLLFLKNAFAMISEIEEVILFGSRATGMYRKDSDVDLAIKGNVSSDLVNHMHFVLEEQLLTRYIFDVVNYGKIKKGALKKHIDEEGIVIYDKKIGIW